MSLTQKISLIMALLIALFVGAIALFYVRSSLTWPHLVAAIFFITAIGAGAAAFLIKSIVPPLKQATAFSNNIAIGYLENAISANGNTELDELLRSLGAIQQSRAEINDHLERQISETETAYFDMQKTSAALRQANTSMNIMLNALNQGLFTFGADGVCSTTCSKACQSLLEGSPAGRYLGDVLHTSIEDSSIRRVLNFVFSPQASDLGTDDILALLPDVFTKSDGTKISLAYYPIIDDEKGIYSVLAVATDNSAEEAALQSMREHEAQALRVLRIVGNRNLFAGFYSSITNFCSRIESHSSNSDSLEVLRRDLHTLKGNASIFQLRDVVDLLHEIEEELTDIADLSQACAIVKGELPRLQAIVANVHKQAYDLLGRDFDQHGVTRTLPLDNLETLARRIKTKTFDSGLYKDFVEQLMGEPIRKSLMAFDLGLRDLADRYGKQVSPCYFTGENFSLLTEKYEPLFAAFSHISRNIISHAIDAPEERAARNKDPELMVLVETSKYKNGFNSWFRIVFQDDGCGIDVARLREKLAERMPKDALDRLDDGAVMNCIFNDNLSTQEQANELAGRGVGLSAIKYEAEKLGGKVSVESERGAYTKIIIDAPIDWSLPEQKA